ncbi:MAG: hypothetical protein MJ016_02145 [Victivallaceae bacterium]|nr:hypothetical protein [Victivallaceae bacterium]
MDRQPTDAEREAAQLHAAFARLVNNEDFRRVVQFLDDFGGYNCDVFTKESERLNAYRQGRQSVAVAVHRIINEITGK